MPWKSVTIRVFIAVACAAIVANPVSAQLSSSSSQAKVPTTPVVPPVVVTVDPAALKSLRDEAIQGKTDLPAIRAVRADAERAMKQEPLSVTDKKVTPPSGDKHDYMSQAPYFWPNPSTPNHLPYVRRDGERNPEINQITDHSEFDKVMNASRALALGYFMFGEERYAQHATELLRAWFLDPATRMNPNLNFGQGVPGVNTGRGIGLIETRAIGKVADAVGLLAGSKSWTAEDDKGLRDWCMQFLKWMQTSKNGRDESNSKNNHGTYYDVQIISLALFTGNFDLARQTLEQAKQKRIAFEVEPDGKQPLELARTKSFSYSAMNLNGLFELARLGDRAGVDLWNFKSKDGRSIRAALDYLLPFALGERKWEAKQIEPINPKDIVAPLLFAAQRYHRPQYREAAMKIDSQASESLTAILIGRETHSSPASGN